jgi:hypothetical protein
LFNNHLPFDTKNTNRRAEKNKEEGKLKEEQKKEENNGLEVPLTKYNTL